MTLVLPRPKVDPNLKPMVPLATKTRVGLEGVWSRSKKKSRHEKLPGGAKREFQESLGSKAHGTGECKPCAWYWKPQGCRNGKEPISESEGLQETEEDMSIMKYSHLNFSTN